MDINKKIKIINIKIIKKEELKRNLEIEKMTFYEIIYQENKQEKKFRMQTFDDEINSLTEKELIKHFKKIIL